VDSSLGSGGSGGGGGGTSSSGGFEGGSSSAASAYSSSAASASAYYSSGGGGGGGVSGGSGPSKSHHHHHPGHPAGHHLPFWPNDYNKYASDCNAAAAFGAAAQSAWCGYSPYASRVPTHMDAYGSHLGAASLTAAAAAAAADEQRRSSSGPASSSSLVGGGGVDPPSFHDAYGLSRNPYGSAAELTASPYPPPGKKNMFFLTSFPGVYNCNSL
jgi:hypothetical protein